MEVNIKIKHEKPCKLKKEMKTRDFTSPRFVVKVCLQPVLGRKVYKIYKYRISFHNGIMSLQDYENGLDFVKIMCKEKYLKNFRRKTY